MKSISKKVQKEEVVVEVAVVPARTIPAVFKNKLLIGGVLVVAIALLPSAYFYSKYQNAIKTPSSQAEAQGIIQKVGGMFILPSGEFPTVATVSDKTKLMDQPFFVHAENGDKVLIYANAKKAILYRPSINKIVEVGPVNLGDTSAQAGNTTVLGSQTGPSPVALTPTPTKKEVSLTILNGTKKSGLAKKAETVVSSSAPEVKVVGRGNAKSDFPKTIVVDVSGANKDEVVKLAQTLNAQVQPYPANEDRVSSDVLIILGSDFE